MHDPGHVRREAVGLALRAILEPERPAASFRGGCLAKRLSGRAFLGHKPPLNGRVRCRRTHGRDEAGLVAHRGGVRGGAHSATVAVSSGGVGE